MVPQETPIARTQKTWDLRFRVEGLGLYSSLEQIESLGFGVAFILRTERAPTQYDFRTVPTIFPQEGSGISRPWSYGSTLTRVEASGFEVSGVTSAMGSYPN